MTKTKARKGCDSKIAIIGAGISGISAALYLEMKGYNNVTIYDSKGYIGGKAHSIRIGDEYVETGAIYLTDGCIRLIDILKKLGLSLHQIDEQYYNYNLDTNKLSMAYSSTSQFNKLENDKRQIRDIISGIDWTADNEKYNISAKQFCIDNGLELYYKQTGFFMSAYGYGNIDDLNALSFIRFIEYQGERYSVEGGMSEIIQTISNNINYKFELNSEITNIDQNGKTITVNGKIKTYDHLIVTLGYTDIAKLIVKDNERLGIFSGTISNPGYSCVFTFENEIPEYNSVPRDHRIRLNSCSFYKDDILHTMIHKDTKAIYIYINRVDGLSELEHIDIIRKKLSPLLGNMELITIKPWDHYHRPSNESVTNGFYGKVKEIQGLNDMYFIGEVCSYGMMGACHDYAEHIVSTYF